MNMDPARLGIIHRDIKPSNFLYDRQRRRYDEPQHQHQHQHQPSTSTSTSHHLARYALVDFGLAQMEEETGEARGRKRRWEGLCW